MNFQPLPALLSLALPAGPRARLSILIYHRVLPETDPLFPAEVDAVRFDRQMRLLRRCFNILPLADAVAALREGTLPARAACITFDDGYADNADVALPILHRHNLHATFFVATGFLDGGRMWNDSVIELVRRAPGTRLDLDRLGLGAHDTASPERKAKAIGALLRALKHLHPVERLAQVNAMQELLGIPLPDDLMMRSDQVRKLHAAGMEIGAHTVNHPILASLGRDDARHEISTGKAVLEDLIDARVRLFAYPNGKPGRDYLGEHVNLVKELQFDAAVTTSWGAAGRGSDPWQLPRFTPWDASESAFLMRLVRNLGVTPETAPDSPEGRRSPHDAGLHDGAMPHPEGSCR